MELGVEFGSASLDVRRWAPLLAPGATLSLHISCHFEHWPSMGGVESLRRRLQGGEQRQGRHHHQGRLNSVKAFASESTDYVPRCLSPQCHLNSFRHATIRLIRHSRKH